MNKCTLYVIDGYDKYEYESVSKNKVSTNKIYIEKYQFVLPCKVEWKEGEYRIDVYGAFGDGIVGIVKDGYLYDGEAHVMLLSDGLSTIKKKIKIEAR